MLESYAEGFLLGLGAAVPIGAINVLIMNQALKTYKGAVAIGLGAMSSDVVYLLLILLGLATFLNNEFFSTTLGVLGSLFLLYMAYGLFGMRNKPLNTKSEMVSKKDLLKNYMKGLTLTAVNPYTIAFWLSIAGYTANKSFDVAFTLFGMLSAIFLWITLMPYFVYRSKHRISKRVSYYISLFSSLILTGFSLSLLFAIFFP